MPLSPGSRLGSYEIVAPLGAGGMGEVYRAHDPRLGRDVALKVLPADMASDPARLERFTREARAIAALNHPHIVTIYSTEEADGIRFLTMELVEGQPLDALIPATGQPLARFLDLALPLADALTAAHAKQITHRDLKPANVMVASDGRVKVLDFGLARVGGQALPTHQTSEATRAVLTSEGTIVGTMPYMSPEQIEGKNLDHRTDVFSLGVMFHEMLTGSRPFAGESSPQLMSSILRDVPVSVSDIRTDVPDALSRLIHRCLEKRPDDRVQTARDIYNELRHLQKQLDSAGTRQPDSTSRTQVSAVAGSLWIAVLPFSLRGADADGDALASGLTEDITAGLARFSGLSVVALQSVRSFKDSTLDVRQIAERLNARYILSGSVRAAASGYRVATHLIDAHSGAQMWTETYDRKRGDCDVFALQDDLTDRIVATVADKSGVLARSLAQAARGIPLSELSALQLVHRSWGFQIRPAPDEHAELRAALETFLRSHPDEPAILSALAQAYVVEHSLGFNPAPDSLGRAYRAARRAVEIDPSHQRGWAELAFICLFRHDAAAIREAAERVLSLNPRDANAVAYVGNVLTHMGEYDHGCELTERAMALNPTHAGWLWFAPFNRHFSRGEFESALRAARRVNIPDLHWMHLCIAAAAGHLGLADEGRTALAGLSAVAPDLLEEANQRGLFARWYWDDTFVERLVDGLARARAGARCGFDRVRIRLVNAATRIITAAGTSGPGRLAPVRIRCDRPNRERGTAVDTSLSIADAPGAVARSAAPPPRGTRAAVAPGLRATRPPPRHIRPVIATRRTPGHAHRRAAVRRAGRRQRRDRPRRWPHGGRHDRSGQILVLVSRADASGGIDQDRWQ
jgi:serine/threonine protein kinase/tetratricopeptide (TPR) repeat protein